MVIFHCYVSSPEGTQAGYVKEIVDWLIYAILCYFSIANAYLPFGSYTLVMLLKMAQSK